jgi:hypothetical protein
MKTYGRVEVWLDAFLNLGTRRMCAFGFTPRPLYLEGNSPWYPVDIQHINEGVSKSFRTGRLEGEQQMVQLSATRCICIAILWVSLASFAAITLCVASKQVTPKVSVHFVIDSVRKILDTPSYYMIFIQDLHIKSYNEIMSYMTGTRRTHVTEGTSTSTSKSAPDTTHLYEVSCDCPTTTSDGPVTYGQSVNTPYQEYIIHFKIICNAPSNTRSVCHRISLLFKWNGEGRQAELNGYKAIWQPNFKFVKQKV